MKLEERVAEATVKKMEADALAKALEMRIWIIHECSKRKNELGMTDEEIDWYLLLDG